MDMRSNKIKFSWDDLSPVETVMMVIMMPIFAIVAGVEQVIARLTGATYNEVNIIVYYMLIPLSWTVMIDFITQLPLMSPMFIVAWILFLWKDTMKFRNRCDWAFDKSVDFLLWFKKIGWNYITSSVIICVVVPIIIYIELIYAINK